MEPQMKDKVVVVTGANSGIGKMTDVDPRLRGDRAEPDRPRRRQREPALADHRTTHRHIDRLVGIEGTR